MITGDLVHMRLDGEILESTLGVVTGSIGDDIYKVLWLDDANSSAQGTYTVSTLYPVSYSSTHPIPPLIRGTPVSATP